MAPKWCIPFIASFKFEDHGLAGSHLYLQIPPQAPGLSRNLGVSIYAFCAMLRFLPVRALGTQH